MKVMNNKIAVVTATRAEYGLLKPVIKRIESDKDLELDLIVTGTHLSEKHGNTQEEILNDGFFVKHSISILDRNNDAKGISKTISNAIEKFSICFSKDRPDMLIILGDRTELLGIAIAAMNERIPIAHISGGEITQGAVDDCVRHALTKMSYLHFPATDIYRKRIIQLGENPERVYNVGALCVENILKTPLLEEKQIRDFMEIDNEPYIVVTFHPVTLESNECKIREVQELCLAMDTIKCNYIITGSNSDVGGDEINNYLSDFAQRHQERIKMFCSLGMKKYLSALKYAALMLGNSSSGITEAPILGTPTVNIGDRQKGRLMADTIINCSPNHEDISNAIENAMGMPHKRTFMFGDGTASRRILEIVKQHLESSVDLKKEFFDVDF